MTTLEQLRALAMQGIGRLNAEATIGRRMTAEELAEFRKAQLMELDPHYCDVIRKRWAEFVHGEGCDWKALTPCAANAPRKEGK